MNSAENVSDERLAEIEGQLVSGRQAISFDESLAIVRELQALRSPPTEDADRVEARLSELDEIADGAWGDNPMVRGKARDEAARLRAEEVRPDQAEGIPPEIARQIENAKPAIDAAERFISAVIEAEVDDWYRENDEGGLLLCHESGAYFDVFAAMRSALAASPRPETVGVSEAMVERLFSEMTRRMELPKHIHQESNPEWLPVDDTQVGVEFAVEFLTAALSSQEGK